MKKITILLLAIFAVGQAFANVAEPLSPAGISVLKKGSVVKLFYRGEHSGKVTVTIANAAGAVVFKETMHDTEQFMRPYNFSGLPEGEYTIELSDGATVHSRKIDYKLPSMIIPAHLARLKQEGRYMLAVPNAGNAKLTISIYDQANKLVYEDREDVNGSFAKVYDLSGIEGNHTFLVTDTTGKWNRLSKAGKE